MSSSGPRKRKWWRRLLKALVLVLVGAVIAGAGALGLACWAPAMHSQGLSEEEALAGALSFEEKLQEVVNAQLSGLPVQVTVTAEEVNGYCTALQRDALWNRLRFQDSRQRRRWRPRDLEEVRISFRGNQAYIVGRLPNRRPEMVLSVRVEPLIEPDGTVVFDVTGIRVGHLPIPGFLARRWFGHITDTRFEQHRDWVLKHMGISGGQLYLWAGPRDEAMKNAKRPM